MGQLTWAEAHEMVRSVAEVKGEWAGIPMPVPDERLVCESRYPYKFLENMGGHSGPPVVHCCGTEDVDETIGIRNQWWNPLHGHVMVYWKAGRAKVVVNPQRPGVRRAELWMRAIGCSYAWDLEAEFQALRKLSELVREHTFKQYMLTGSFLERSKRSDVMYMFRKGRPTLAIGSAPKAPWLATEECGTIVLAALCLHPLAYYAGTWAGAMVPTDDVIAHLLLMRGDEKLYWRRSNQHNPEEPEAGI